MKKVLDILNGNDLTSRPKASNPAFLATRSLIETKGVVTIKGKPIARTEPVKLAKN